MQSRISTTNFMLDQVLKGNAFQVPSGPLTVTSVSPFYFLIATSNEELIITDVIVTASGDDVTAEGFKDSEVSNLGSAVTAVNKNTTSDYELHASLYSGSTVTNEGTMLDSATAFGSNQMPQRSVTLADISKGDAYVLASNSQYLFKVTSSGTSNLYFTITFVESNYIRD
jgi:hypothetical protein